MKEQQFLLGTLSEAINKVLKNSPFMCVYVTQESVSN